MREKHTHTHTKTSIFFKWKVFLPFFVFLVWMSWNILIERSLFLFLLYDKRLIMDLTSQRDKKKSNHCKVSKNY